MKTDILIHASRSDEREAIGLVARNTSVFSKEELDTVFELFDSYMKGPESGYQFLSAEIDGALIGFACFGLTPLTEGAFDFYWLGIDPSMQKKGVGRALCEAVELEVRKQKGRLIGLWTSGTEEYLPATRLYERIGYQQAARVRDYYHPGDDLLIYIKYL